MTTIKNNPHTAQSADTAKPKLREARSSRYLSIFALLTLTAALATLPALGDLNFLKRDYTYLEKIPVKSVSSYTDGFTYDSNQKQTGNLLGDNKETQWISWKNNVIWSEDYSTDRYFTGTVIDGVNEEGNTDKNNTHSSSANGVLSVQNAGAKWRQFNIFQSSAQSQLNSLVPGTYTLKMRYRGDVDSDGVDLFLGNPNFEEVYCRNIGVSTEWTEKEFTFEVTQPISYAWCAVQPLTYNGTFEIDWAELSYVSPYPTLPIISELATDNYTIGGPYDFLTLENGCITTEKTDGLYQFRLANDVNLVAGNQYQVRLQIQGTVAGELVLWCGPFHGKKFTVPTADISEVVIDLGTCDSNTGTWLAIQTSDLDNSEWKSYLGKILVKQAILEHKDANGNWVADKTINYGDYQNWPNQTSTDYIPSLVTENGKTVAKITNPKIIKTDDQGNEYYADYAFRWADKLSIPKGNYTLKAKINNVTNSGQQIHLMIGTGANNVERNNHFTLDPNKSDEYVWSGISLERETGYWIVCQPIGGYDSNRGNYTGDFTIESIELIPEGVTVKDSFTIRNEGTATYDVNNASTEIKDGIIYSHPLPTTRKVIVATGDGSHTSEQYNGWSGFTLESPHVYTVSYNITSERAATVKTMLANKQDLDNAKRNGSVWDESLAIGVSDTIQLLPGVTRAVTIAIEATENSGVDNGAVVLDLGYDLGSVEVTDLKIIDNYDPSLTNRDAQMGQEWTHAAEINEPGQMDYQQVQVMSGLTLNKSEKYTVTVRMKATKDGKLCLKLGSIWPGQPREVLYKDFSASSDWQDVVFTAEDGVPEDNGGVVGLQLQTRDGSNTYDGIVTVQLVKITSSNWVDDESQEVALNYANGDKYTGSTFSNSDYPKVEDGKLIFDEIRGVDTKFIVKTGLGDIDQAKTYKIYLKSKGTVDTQFRVLFGSDGANAVGFVDVDASDDFTEKEALLNNGFGQYNTIAHNSVLQLQTQGTQGRVEIESIRVVPNANEHVAWFTDGSGEVSGLGDYKDFQVSDNGLQLNVQNKPITCGVINDLELTVNKSYTVDFEIQAAAGRYIVALGEGATSLTREIVITEDEANKYVKKEVNFGSNASESGSLTISPVGYTANLNVRNANITEYTPGFKQGDMIGTDFFEVELGDVKDNAPYVLDKEGKYVFHIGYVADGNDTPATETPKSIMIAASNSKDGTYTRLGLCELIDMQNGNAFFSTVNNPLKNIEDWSNYRYLRIYCVDNMGEETALCFPKTNGNYDTEHPYVGSMMRVNRFAIYKQSTMFATDKENYGNDEEKYDDYDKWAIPAITRFQIEALGQKYAYPGANLEDMLGVKKDTEICGELFDNDVTGNNSARITYWDTTLPFVMDGERATQDKYQYLKYDGFNYPVEYNGNLNYDCIDLLLPDMKDLGAVKKYNGRITEDTDAKGYYQVVVSMGRSTGNMDTFSNRLNYNVSRTDTIDKKQVLNPDGTPKLDDDKKPIYEYTVNTIVSDETADFVNRANGFPIEISYQGLKIDANHNKTAQPIGEPERIFTFPTVAAGDSIHFALKVEEGWDGVRIFCRENHGNLERRAGGSKLTNKAETDRWNVRVVDVTNNDPVPGTRIMRLGEIRAYIELNKIDLETPEGRQRYDLLYNNREAFNTRGWRHTKGIIDDINNVNSVNNETTDLYMKKGDGGQTWEDVLNTYKDFFKDEGIEIPDFSLIENPFDDEDVVPSNGMQRVYANFNGQKRQRSYTIIHEVLALPGERVDLYPQSDIWMRNGWNYEEQFVRWYDYLTDKAPDYLYFFAEPKSVIKTTDAGFIGGKTLLDHGLRGKGTVASVYFNTTNANDDWSYNDGGITRMKDQWVAADFSLAFNNKLQERLSRATGEKEDTIHEPVINFRHLFHITSGSLFAERYMATAEGNRHYAKSNRRYISSFANKTFRIRLDQAMPADAGTKSPFYYKTTQTNEKGEPIYDRVRDYEIRTYKLGNQTSDDFVKTIRYNDRNKDQVIDTIFKMDDSSIFDHIDSYVQTTTPSSRWLRNSKRFARAIKCRKEHTEGRYLVRLYGKDASGNVIKLTGKDESGENDVEVPLVIAEYEVEFLDDKHASFISEDELKKIGEGHDQEHHTEKYLDEHYSNGKSDVKVVDFDKYTILKSKNQIVDKNSAPVNFERYGFFEYKDWGVKAWRLKLPIAWGNSNYGFGYYSQGDYNMFRLADNSAITPYKTAADKRDYNPLDAEYGEVQKGTYDRLFYNTGGKEKGLFYYVNAAADPGEMVKLDFDYLCPGSTIYVSAWVNEFNEGQPETANVIFNFFANVAKDVDGKKTILRQEQIHGFATGYVKKNPEDNYENGGTTGGDQGKWMHVYYSFVPDPSHADVLAADGEYIDSYNLVLENNCLSSSGADYAIDDIRAYVVAPRVDAEQSNALCEKNDVKVDIEVQLPLEALETSLAGKVDPDGIVRLQYSMVDKVKYDELLDEKRKNLQGDQELSTDDYYDAFAKSVLHYKRDNVRVNAEGTLSEEPLSWGMIEFYMDYKDKADTDVIPVSINGVSGMTVGDYKKKYIKTIENEKCFVFTTHPVSDNESDYNDDFDNKHRSYYIVVDNIGTTGVFTSLFYEYENGELKLDENKNPVLKEEYKDKDINNIWNAAVYPALDKKNEWYAYDKELAKAYQICTDCSRMAEFTLRSAALIVVDGVLHETDDNITCCENQRPVVQIDLKAKPEEKEEYSYDDLDVVDGSPLSENPYLDWWNGPYEKFASQTSNVSVPGSTTGQKYTLWDVLDYFRRDYPNADTWNVPCVGEKDEKGNLLTTGATDENGNLLKDEEGNPRVPKNYTAAMRSYLAGFCATTKIDDTTKETVPVEPKLVLHQSSFMFPQSETILVDKNGNPLKTKDIYVTAIPLSFPTVVEKEDLTYVVCTQPREIKITVTNTSPTMFNGFKDITYPETIEDVPLRIGLKQLDNIIADNAASSANTLYVPLRSVNPATFDVKAFKSVAEDTNVYLEETNDPEYRLLSDYEKPGATVADKTMYNVDRRIVGKVNSIVANFTKKTDGTIDINGVPMAQIVFLSEEKNITKLPKGIEFREGYYYKFRFGFEEDTDGSDLYKQPGFEVPCKGQTVFSIKVVPEYQIWTGDSSLNWNNDDNWRRVRGTEELLADSDTPYGIKKGLSAGETSDVRFTVNDAHPNTHSYAPLNFTKVIIPAGASYPQLAPRKHSQGAVSGAETIPVANGRKEESYVWASPEKDKPNSNAPRAVTAAGNGKESITVGLSSGESYHPTLYVQYDMAAIMYNDVEIYKDDYNVYCRPWYANACEEIHFDSNAEILNQQNLDYQKAWVDMEMTPHRWYNVASPLYGVVAGDMYLPSVGASTPGRQMTELFAPITYNNTDKTKNDRFAPAVYQRGWDKGTETVYTVHNDVKTETETVALASTWSHVYNDVTEEYAPGMGYSVKTDVTRLPKFADSYSESDKQTYVKFRFPKADKTYNYFEDGNTTPGELNKDALPRVAKEQTEADKYYSHRLFEMNGTSQTVSLKKGNDGYLFLVGNPFMAHLDMAEFLKENEGVIQSKFWVMTETDQVGAVLNDSKDTEILTHTATDFARLAPMQGFFVQAKTAGTSLSIKFTPDMMAVEPYDTVSKPQLLKAPAYGTRGDGDDIIRVSTEESTAIIRLSAAADKGYAASEDVEMIDDSNQRNIRRIYTVAGTMASAINQTPDADGVEVGLMAPADSVTNVVFNGVALEDYMLYDTATGEMTQLYDGFELEMEGSVSGRYFLTAGIDTAEIEDGTIRIIPGRHEVVVTAPAVCGEMTVRVFDTLGREVAKAEGMEGEVRIALDPGIYAVEAVGADAGRKSAKLRIR